jgi:hypothetical protein
MKAEKIGTPQAAARTKTGTARGRRPAEAGREGAGEVARNAGQAVRAGQAAVADAAQTVALTAADARDAVVAGARSTLAAVRDVAVETADDARTALTEVGDRLARTLEGASAEGEADALRTRLMATVASGLTRASDVLRQKSVTDLAADVKVLARRHPGVFVAAAAVAGFAAARFVRSSARQREQSRLAAGEGYGGQGPRA